jgi:hypothetical protein
MIITRHGNCETCKLRIIVKRNFGRQADMFDDNEDTPGKIHPDIIDQLKEWREQPIYCKKHGGD